MRRGVQLFKSSRRVSETEIVRRLLIESSDSEGTEILLKTSEKLLEPFSVSMLPLYGLYLSPVSLWVLWLDLI